MLKKLFRIFLVVFFTAGIFTINLDHHEEHEVYAYYDGQPCPNTVRGNPCTGILTADVANIPQCNEPAITITYSCTFCDYTVTEAVQPMPHNYVLSTSESKKETCTEDGYNIYYCSNTTYTGTCNHKKTESIPATGHNFQIITNTSVACLQDGYFKQECLNCNKVEEKTTKALGHNYKETENVEPTCLEDGHITRTCTRCKDVQTEVIEKLGHDVEYKVTKLATCIELGIESGICKNCGEEFKEEFPATGHNYPYEWTVEKESTFFSTGLKSKTCVSCKDRIEEIIEKEPISPVIYNVSGTIALGGIIAAILKKTGKTGIKKAVSKTTKKAIKDTTEDIFKEAAEKELLKPEFEEKILVTCLKNDSFYKILKIQKYLKIIEAEYDSLTETINENEPSLVLIDVTDIKLKKFTNDLKKLKEECEDTNVSLLVSNAQIDKEKKLLEKLKEKQVIKDYGNIENNANVNMIKLVLPVMKPDLKSDEGLENIGMIADALNIPGVSTLISAYINGREIKETIDEGKEEGLGFVDKATIISDIAAILGLDTISGVAGVVGDMDDIKTSLEAKIGGDEVRNTKEAIEDIVDVVSDIADR